MKPLCRPLSWLAVLALGASLTACGTETRTPAQPRATGSPSNGELPDSVPVPAGEVTTRFPVTVLDDGDGPELCLGGVAESLPPQCGGPRLVGWDWTEHDSDYEEAGGTRWGDFVVSGVFDGTTMTPRDVVPAEQYDAPPDRDEGLATSCAEPPGGWVVDPDRVTMTDFDAAMRTASRLDDYASSFVDSSRDPRSPEQMDQDFADGEDDVSWWIVNVAVTEDPDAAAAAIREVWGVGVCVTTAEVTDRELRRTQQAVSDADVPGFLSSGSDADTVHVHVIHDDGSIQAWADQEFGADLVVVSSALVRTS